MKAKIELKVIEGSTPLNPDETNGLLVDYITTQSELNELEQKNILEANVWLMRKKTLNVLDPSFAFELHKKMFEHVWEWAGQVRRSEKNIGVPSGEVMQKLPQHFKNIEYRVNHFPNDLESIAIEFHHGLVWIHAFPNGNGRHARLMTDLLLKQYNFTSFTWGANSYSAPMEVEGVKRNEYISALKLADKKQFDLLLKFAKS